MTIHSIPRSRTNRHERDDEAVETCPLCGNDNHCGVNSRAGVKLQLIASFGELPKLFLFERINERTPKTRT